MFLAFHSELRTQSATASSTPGIVVVKHPVLSIITEVKTQGDYITFSRLLKNTEPYIQAGSKF